MATIQGVYVALFGRPADPTGLAFFNGVTKNGADLSGIGDLASTQEYKDRFANQSNTSIVNSIYQSLFGRDAEAAGLNFFVDALNKGTLNIKNIAIAILDGAQGTDKTIVANKVAAADLYTKSLDTAPEIGSYVGNAAAAQGRAFLAGVTTTVPGQSSVDNAIIQMQVAGSAGNTINATAAITTLNLTTGIAQANGSTLATTNNNDTINATTTDWWTGDGSKIDAGLGVDTLNATINNYLVAGANTKGVIQADGLKNVEIVNLTSVQTASTVNFANAKEVTQVWHVAGANTVAANTSIDLNVTNLALTATYGVRGDVKASADSVAFASADASSTVKVAFDGAVGTGSLTVNGVGTVGLTNTGTSSLPITSNAKALTVAGDGTLTLAVTDTVLETVNASSFSGSLNTNLSANVALKSFVGGTGADSVTLNTVHNNDITVNGGAGNDTITVLGNASTTGVVGAPGSVVTTAYTNNASAKAIVLTGGDGADTFTFGTTGATPKVGDSANSTNVTAGAVGNVTAVDTAANLVKSLITISDFNKSADGIKVSDGVTTGGGRQSILDSDLNGIKAPGAYSDLLAAVTKVASITDINKVAVFDYAGDAYIFVQNSTTALDSGDSLIKVTGVTTADLTATNFAII